MGAIAGFFSFQYEGSAEEVFFSPVTRRFFLYNLDIRNCPFHQTKVVFSSVSSFPFGQADEKAISDAVNKILAVIDKLQLFALFRGCSIQSTSKKNDSG